MFLTFQILVIVLVSAAVGRRTEEYMTAQEVEDVFGIPNAADYELISINLPKRTKRTLDHQFTLSFIKDKRVYDIALTKITDNFLVNSNTGIWGAATYPNALHSVVYYPRESILKDIGEMIFYQDRKTGSAITLFLDNSDNYYMSGILYEKYIIKDIRYEAQNIQFLSNSQWSNSHAVRRSVNSKNSDTDEKVESKWQNSLYAIFKMPQKMNAKLYKGLHSIRPELNTNRIRRQAEPIPTVVYPKILVNLYSDYIWTNNTVEVVKYMICFWNIVDMIFRKLSNPEVRLNMAGFIIPMDPTASPYLGVDPLLNDVISFNGVTDKISEHFYSEAQRFPHENYNIPLAMIAKPLCSMFANGVSCAPIAGESSKASACDKTNSEHGGKIESTGIAQFDWFYGGVSTVANVLGRILGATEDKTLNPRDCSLSTGNIMVGNVSFIRHLDWSSCSKSTIASYLKSTEASCLHRKPNNVPSKLKYLKGAWLSLDGQCQNSYRDSKKHCILTSSQSVCQSHGCEVSSKCVTIDEPPLDGSGCTLSNGNVGYCQENQCLPLP